jgi:ERCC4-related helicase
MPDDGGKIATGMQVRFRGLAWTVIDVQQLGEQTRVGLRCAGGDLDGLSWTALYPAELVEVLEEGFRPNQPGDLKQWRLRHKAMLLGQRLGGEDVRLVAPGRVRVEPYQLVPLLRAKELLRVRLLLADDVGLGKTVQACLVLTELIARRQTHRILIIAPAGPLLMQWDQELRQRFGLRFTCISDFAGLQVQRRRMELGANPFEGMSLCLISLDFAKQERVLQDLERARWDAAVIDEAHHCVGDTVVMGAESTLRRRLAEVVARRSDALLLLTATPHDGVDAHFGSLIALLDPSLVDGPGGGLIGNGWRAHVVRRLKGHIREPGTGRPMFRDRCVVPVRVDADGERYAAVRAFHAALAEVVVPRLRVRRPGRDADALAFVGLLKRSVSTLAACVATLRVVAQRCEHGVARGADLERGRALRRYQQRLRRFGTLDAASEADLAELEAEGMAAQLRRDTAGQLQTLITMGQVASSADPKLDALVSEVRAIRRERPGANVLIYTEHADSLRAAVETLGEATPDAIVLSITGNDSERTRMEVTERFGSEDGLVLVSTDTLAEGLNLHRRCSDLIHLDLPYNPNRLEQRNGRIDRYGQQAVPTIRYLYLAGTFEEDLLLRLITKHEAARASLEVMPETLGVTADAPRSGLVSGFAQRQAELFAPGVNAIRTIDREAIDAGLDAYRALLRDVERAYDERIALRYGWLPTQSAVTLVMEMKRAEEAGDDGVELSRFIAEAIEADAGIVQAENGKLQLDDAWCSGLEGLPGFDAPSRSFRFSRDLDVFQQGALSVGFIGLAHPLTRRAVNRMQMVSRAGVDMRVAAAGPAESAGLLLTYVAEIRSARAVELRKLIAVRVNAANEVFEVTGHDFLACVERLQQRELPAALKARLVCWQKAGIRAAKRILAREAEQFRVKHAERVKGWRGTLERWVAARASAVCGAEVAAIADLFEPAAEDRPMDAWDRLALAAGDQALDVSRRRDAAWVVRMGEEQRELIEHRATLGQPQLTPVGMLVLVP